jgi:MFS transporter, PAT family, beta-lactamase induction signal transducer AmpG
VPTKLTAATGRQASDNYVGVASDSAARRSGGWRRSFTAYRNPHVLLTLPLGFSSGLPLLLTFSTLSARLATGGISRGAIGAFALVGTPYAFKFLWSPLIDRLPPPLPLGRRRGWGLSIQIALIVATLALGRCNPRGNLAAIGLLALIVAFLSASQDIVIDAWRVEILDQEQQGPGAAMIQTGYRIGMLVSGAGALMIAARAGWFVSYAIMAGLLAIGMLAFLLGPEPAAQADVERFAMTSSRPLHDQEKLGGAERSLAHQAERSGAELTSLRGAQLNKESATSESESDPALRGAGDEWIRSGASAPALTDQSEKLAALRQWLSMAVIGPFEDFMQRPYWPAILLFVFGYKLGEATAGVMAMPLYVALGFSLNEIAAISKVVGFVATIVGALAGGTVTARFGVVRALIVCGLLQSAGNLFYVLQVIGGHRLDYLALCVAAENVTSGMAGAALVAYLSGLCSPAFTATQYALLSSLAAVGRTLVASTAGVLAERMGWELFFLSTTVVTLPALLLLAWLARRSGDNLLQVFHPFRSN